MTEKIIMVHLAHPCREIDVDRISEDYESIYRGQGYIRLSELRQLKAERDALLTAARDALECLEDIWLGKPEESEPIDPDEVIESLRYWTIGNQQHEDSATYYPEAGEGIKRFQR